MSNYIVTRDGKDKINAKPADVNDNMTLGSGNCQKDAKLTRKC